MDKVQPALLSAAMTALGYAERDWSFSGSTLRIRGERSNPDLTAKVKSAITRATVMAQAKRFGWGVKEQPDGKLLLQKARL